MPLVEQLVPHDLLAFCTTHEPDPNCSREEHAEVTGARFEQAFAATASAADGPGDEGVLLVLKLHDALLNGALGHEPDDAHLLGLPEAVHAVHRLGVWGGGGGVGGWVCGCGCTYLCIWKYIQTYLHTYTYTYTYTNVPVCTCASTALFHNAYTYSRIKCVCVCVCVHTYRYR